MYIYTIVSRKRAIVHPSPSIASIAYRGLKRIWRSAHLVQIGIFHSWACGETGYTHYKMQIMLLHSGLH